MFFDLLQLNLNLADLERRPLISVVGDVKARWTANILCLILFRPVGAKCTLNERSECPNCDRPKSIQIGGLFYLFVQNFGG